MKRFIFCLAPALLAALFLAPAISFASTYYVSISTGSDSNTSTQAQSKSTPWAHLPGMPTATGTAAGSYSAVAGDVFILMGCDVWYNTAGTSNFPLQLSNGGSSGNPVTITVDKTWYITTNCPSGAAGIEVSNFAEFSLREITLPSGRRAELAICVHLASDK